MLARGPIPGRLETRGLVLSTLLLAWCLSLIAIRVLRTGSPHMLFLVWNLFLASIPLAGARALKALNRRGASRWAQGSLFVLWLVFLPNAPYIVTDLVHLSPQTGAVYWYDLGLLLSCAATGLLLGYLSLLDIQQLVEDRFGIAAGWLTAGGTLMLSGFGVYLGRVMRWNSWNVVTDPVSLFGSVASFFLHVRSHLHTSVVTLLFGVGLVLGYVALHFLAAIGGQREHAGRQSTG